MFICESFLCTNTTKEKVTLIHARNNCQDLSVWKKCCSLGLANCCWLPNCITKTFLLILLEIFRDYVGRYGEHCCKFSLQPNEYKKCYCVLPNNCSRRTFLKKSCSLGLGRWFATKLHNSKSFWSICMKFSGWACLNMKKICGKFRCKQTSTRKVIALAFIYANPHLTYLIEWRMRHSAPCAFERRMTHTCVNQRRRC